MKITERLKELLFVMHLQRELDLQRMMGKTPDLKKDIETAMKRTIVTIETIKAKGL